MNINSVCLYTNLLRNMELTSSCVTGGFFELAAILSGLRKQVTNVDSC